MIEAERNAFMNFNYAVLNLQCYNKGFQNGGRLRPFARQMLASFLCNLRSAVEEYTWSHRMVDAVDDYG